MGKSKNKFYKRWWFWLIIVLVGLAAYGNSLEDKAEQKESNTPSISTTNNQETSETQEEDGGRKEDDKEKEDKSFYKAIKDIDWDKVIEETKKELTNPEYFGFVKDIHIEVKEEESKILFTAVVGDATAKDVAVDFADTLIRRFSGNVQIQNSNIKGPGHEYLGQVFDYYDILVGVAPFSKSDNSKEWYVFDAIPKGAHRNPRGKK